MKKIATFSAAVLMGLLISGCGDFQKWAEKNLVPADTAMEDAYLISFNEVIRYPRGVDRLEKRLTTYTGREIWYKSHPTMSSNAIREIRAVPIPGKPELCSLELRLSRQGRMKWQILYQLHKETPLIMLIDGEWVCDFVPGSLTEPDQEWVKVDCEVDSVTAAGLVFHAPANFRKANPDDKQAQLHQP